MIDCWGGSENNIIVSPWLAPCGLGILSLKCYVRRQHFGVVAKDKSIFLENLKTILHGILVSVVLKIPFSHDDSIKGWRGEHMQYLEGSLCQLHSNFMKYDSCLFLKPSFFNIGEIHYVIILREYISLCILLWILWVSMGTRTSPLQSRLSIFQSFMGTCI